MVGVFWLGGWLAGWLAGRGTVGTDWRGHLLSKPAVSLPTERLTGSGRSSDPLSPDDDDDDDVS